MYRKPKDGEYVVCPESRSGRKHAPERVYDGINPDGKPAPRGILGSHRHGWGEPECGYSGLPVSVVPIDKKEPQLNLMSELAFAGDDNVPYPRLISVWS